MNFEIVIIIIIYRVFARPFHIHIAAKDLCPSLHFEFPLPSFPCHFLEALDNLRQVYHAYFFHVVASRRELLYWFLLSLIAVTQEFHVAKPDHGA